MFFSQHSPNSWCYQSYYFFPIWRASHDIPLLLWSALHYLQVKLRLFLCVCYKFCLLQLRVTSTYPLPTSIQFVFSLWCVGFLIYRLLQLSMKTQVMPSPRNSGDGSMSTPSYHKSRIYSLFIIHACTTLWSWIVLSWKFLCLKGDSKSLPLHTSSIKQLYSVITLWVF